MSLYISNPSRQTAVFFYRRYKVPRGSTTTSGPSSVTIPSGEQVVVGATWSPDETKYVIEQILAAGGANASEAHGRMGSGFTGLLYREDYPVDEGEIILAHESIVEHAQERSVGNATRAALAFDTVVQKAGGKESRGGKQRPVKMTEVEVEQVVPRHQRKTGDEVHFKLSVDPEGSADAKGVFGAQ